MILLKADRNWGSGRILLGTAFFIFEAGAAVAGVVAAGLLVFGCRLGLAISSFHKEPSAIGRIKAKARALSMGLPLTLSAEVGGEFNKAFLIAGIAALGRKDFHAMPLRGF